MKWLAVAAATLVAGFAALWIKSGETMAPPAVAAEARAEAVARAAPATPRPAAEGDADRDAEGDAPTRLRPHSEAFWSRVDEGYTRGFIAAAADCYRGGKDRKQKLKIGYRLVIEGGKVSARDVRVVDSTLGDAALEKCMLRAIAAARLDDGEMPDWSTPAGQEETLLVRVGSLGRFRSGGE